MKDKPTIIIYFNNLIAFLLLRVLRALLREPAKGNNLLLINTGQIGDIIISSVILKNRTKLMKHYEKIYFISKKEYSSILLCYPGINVIPWNYKKYKFNLFYRVKFLLKLRKTGFSVCLNLTAARGITVDELSLLSGAVNIYALNSNYRYLKKLFGGKIDRFYSAILANNILNEYEKHLDALRFLGITAPEKDTYFPVSQKTLSGVEHLLREFHYGRKIVISPLTEIKIKNWGLSNYSDLIKRLIDEDKTSVIFIFGSAEQSEIVNELTSLDKKRIINLAGKLTIPESAALLEQCDFYIGNDSGFTHIAKALNKTFIGIIGGGSTGYFFPYNSKGKEAYLFNEMECFGCEWRCVYDQPYCLSGVTVDTVLKNYYRLINENT